MTIPVQNTALSSTFDFWRGRTNEMANYMSTCVITTSANSSTVNTSGNAVLTGTFSSNVVSAGLSTTNVTINSTSVSLTDSTTTLNIKLPSTSEFGNNFLLAANGVWTYVPTTNSGAQYDGTNIKTINSYLKSEYNAVEYLLHVTDLTNDPATNGYYTSKILTTHDSNNAFITEYAAFTTNASLGVFTVGTNTTHVILYFDPINTVANCYVKYVRTVL